MEAVCARSLSKHFLSKEVHAQQSALHDLVSHSQQVTCAHNRQQPLNVFLQSIACRSSAPEAPATAPSNDSQKPSEDHSCKQGKHTC